MDRGTVFALLMTLVAASLAIPAFTVANKVDRVEVNQVSSQNYAAWAWIPFAWATVLAFVDAFASWKKYSFVLLVTASFSVSGIVLNMYTMSVVFRSLTLADCDEATECSECELYSDLHFYGSCVLIMAQTSLIVTAIYRRKSIALKEDQFAMGLS